MEGVSQLRRAREILAACPEYWLSGKPHLEAEVAAACEGLLAGGATEVVVLDNHGSGNPTNIAAEALPAGARLEAWNLWDFPNAAWTRCSKSVTTPAEAWMGSYRTRTCPGSVCALATS